MRKPKIDLRSIEIVDEPNILPKSLKRVLVVIGIIAIVVALLLVAAVVFCPVYPGIH
jgi:hypothetical protein